MRPYVYFLVGAVLATVIVARVVPPSRRPADAGRPEAGTTRILIPVDGVSAAHLKSNFLDQRGTFRIHHALDIMAPRGTIVRAAVPGTIRKLFTSHAGGITIYEFDQDQARCYYYAHLDHYADGIHEGMNVRQGEVIGYVGTTGNAPANAPHLHFAISILPESKEWWKGEPIDPYPLLVQTR
ncbi:MAG TPA: M23 family metallopeptidase [Thermoanaerobaculia bacterium]|nr:M23 family metallopeptidase [Thermoanaerobaculia bacterium]